ncbi:MAG TPA: chromate transporter [Ktedonobacterales bacterium]
MINPLVYFILFLKASLFSSGGFSNLPSLHQDLLAKSWATDTNFGQAIAIGQISPGPNGLWVISLGYFTYGVAGALLALVAITLPPLLVLVISAQYAKVEGQAWMQGAMHGVSIAVISLLISVISTILRQPGVDGRGLLITLGAVGLGLTRKVNVLLILTLAGLVGYLIYR